MFCTRARSCARADDAKSCAVGMRNAKPGNHLKSATAKKFVDTIHLLHLIATFAPKRIDARSTILQRSLFGRHAILSF